MAGLSFVFMFVRMYAMVDRFENVFPNINQFYMAALMTAPMVAIELSFMRSMFPSKQWNITAWAATVVVLVVAFLFIRQQVGVSDRQFLRSMIPHHAAAILMCEKASIQDPEVRDLCEGIASGQQAEIDQMKAILERTG